MTSWKDKVLNIFKSRSCFNVQCKAYDKSMSQNCGAWDDGKSNEGRCTEYK